MSIMQNNHIYKDLVKYFRLKVLLNLKSQVNIQNVLNNILNYLPLDSKLMRFYKPKFYLPLMYNILLILPL